ncbi:hypothetical protein JW960_02310 [candidate division KSB1 bacterium]|nr:hypothetical protein [candidate division KSB1 bacterium]
MKIYVILISLLLVRVFGDSEISAKAMPDVHVVSISKAFDNGEHNAFTDLCRFNDKIYLTFRTCPDGHMVFPSSSILVLSSVDGQTWEQVHSFSVENRDTRDPHFLVFQNKLFVFTGTWLCKNDDPGGETRDLNQHLGYCVWTSNGTNWNGPEMLEGTYGHYIWRAATYNGNAYLCGRRKHEFREMPRNDESQRITESAMLESDDGIIWKKAALFQEHNGDETAFLFKSDGTVLAVARRGTANAELCRSKPPYQEWQRKDLCCYVGGPLLAEWNDHYIVGGRKMTADGLKTTVLYWLVDDQLHECLQFPSGGDNSYPGFVKLDENRALVSYYSSHEKDENGDSITAIYVAVLEMQE